MTRIVTSSGLWCLSGRVLYISIGVDDTSGGVLGVHGDEKAEWGRGGGGVLGDRESFLRFVSRGSDSGTGRLEACRILPYALEGRLSSISHP